MFELTESWYLVLAAMIFAIGATGLLVRRNPLVMFMCVELMLNAVNLSFVAFSRALNDVGGQAVVFFVLVVAAAEVVVGPGHHRGHHAQAAGCHRRRHLADEGLTDGSAVAHPGPPGRGVPDPGPVRPPPGRPPGRRAGHRSRWARRSW